MVSACDPANPKVVSVLAKLEAKVLDACPDGATIAAAGYPAALQPANLVDRFSEACQSEAATLVARSFGGPKAVVRSGAVATDQKCLDYAYDQGRKMIDYALKQQSKCVLAAHAGKTCDPADPSGKIASRDAKVSAAIAKRCAALPSLVAIDPPTFVTRASDQAECLAAVVHTQSAPLNLACGPRASISVPSLETPTQVVLDSGTWGSRCGDGSDYAFWIRLAPAGEPVGRVVVFMQGGGSCIDGPDCAATSADLFEAQSDTLPNVGILSNTASTNPFRDWTKVLLPYCTQDGHVGGGVVNAFPEKTVYRYGALNVRTAMRYVRDVLWASMDGTDPEGFRPDRLLVLFSGSSAGGFGAQFNYHYVLDDLRWVHTTLLADSSLGMDNGMGSALPRGTLAFMPTTPGWGAEPGAPPYCHDPTCAEGWNHFLFAMSPRLEAVPEQQVLTVTNQVDGTERKTQGFASNADFVNTLRARYCEQKGTNGLYSFLSASTQQQHGNINENAAYNNVIIGGTRMRDWLGGAMTSPADVIDKVAEGTLQQDIAGVGPFPCTVGSPSGAFVDG